MSAELAESKHPFCTVSSALSLTVHLEFVSTLAVDAVWFLHLPSSRPKTLKCVNISADLCGSFD